MSPAEIANALAQLKAEAEMRASYPPLAYCNCPACRPPEPK